MVQEEAAAGRGETDSWLRQMVAPATLVLQVSRGPGQPGGPAENQRGAARKESQVWRERQGLCVLRTLARAGEVSAAGPR